MSPAIRQSYITDKLTVRSLSDEQNENDLVVEGYFARFNSETELWKGAFESIHPDAFNKSLTKNDIRCLFNHNSDFVLGRTSNNTLELKADEKGLYGKLRINSNDLEAVNVYQRVKRRDITGCSFGFEPLDEQTDFLDDNTVKTIIREANLIEVSIVTFPAYPQTEIEARKQDYDSKQTKKRQLWKKQLKERMTSWH